MSRDRALVLLAAVMAVIVVAGLTTLYLVSRPDDPAQTSTAHPRPHDLGAHHATGRDNGDHDPFGITHLQPTMPGGIVWNANWTSPRSFDGVDPADPWFDANHGQGYYRVESGNLFISGAVPRMFIHDPDLQRQWRDVEVTMYFKRVADADVPYAGMTAVVRSNHGMTGSDTEDLCDTRGYGARMRFDGTVDFEKETSHPRNTAVADQPYFGGPMPKGQWIGYKFLAYDRPDGVHLEMWVDRTDGADGGTWDKVNEMIDGGGLFGDTACARGVDPKMALTNAPTRIGSESGKPNVAVYFRSDGISDDGLIYKWGSVREIKVAN